MDPLEEVAILRALQLSLFIYLTVSTALGYFI